MRDIEKTIGKMIEKQKIAFIGTVDCEGFPTTKAMLAPRKCEGIQVIYFSTNTSSLHVSEYRANPKACVYFCDSKFYKGAVLKGTMEVLEDEQSKEMLWRIGDRRYYPKGVTDPDYCVLKFTAQKGRFYSFGSKDFEIGS